MMDRNSSITQFTEAVRAELEKVGLDSAELVSSVPESAVFGDAAAIFQVGPLLLRVTRERGQQFVDMAAQAEPTKFHQFDDVDIAMGWRSLDEVLAKQEPEPINMVLQRVKENLDAFIDAFSGGREQFTRARLEKVAHERGQAFTDRLRGK